MTEAFYVQQGTTYTPTDYVTGPWDPDLCHAGPPTALLLDAFESATPGMGVTRATFEIPRPIPKVPVTVEVIDIRPGKKVRMMRGALVDADGTELLTAHAWAIRETEGFPVAVPPVPDAPPPEDCDVWASDMGLGYVGYLDAVEIRAIRGTPFRGGSASAWVRSRIPLVDARESDPANAVALYADLGSGIGAVERFSSLIGINTDLSTSIARRPKGSWVVLDSSVISHGMGLGISDTLIYDASGFVARANQSIYFDRP